MRCAVVAGTGWQGCGIATRIAAAGWTAVIGSRDVEKARRRAAMLPDFVGLPAERFEAASNADCVRGAELVFVAAPSTGHRQAVEAIRETVDEEALVIDVTAPVNPENHLEEIWPEEGSYTAQTQEILGEMQDVVGAFKNVSATMLLNHTMAPNSDILIVGDELQAKHRATLICKQMGFTGYDAGKLEHAPQIEALTRLLIHLTYAYHLNQPGIKLVELARGMEILPDDELFRD